MKLLKKSKVFWKRSDTEYWKVEDGVMCFISRILGQIQEVQAMAFQRKVALRKLSELQLEIANHLFFVVHYPDHQSFNHWMKELRAWNGKLRQYNLGKGQKPNFTRSLLIKFLWEAPLGGDKELELAKELAIEKGLPNPKLDPVKLKSVVEKYCDTIMDSQTFTL